MSLERGFTIQHVSAISSRTVKIASTLMIYIQEDENARQKVGKQ